MCDFVSDFLERKNAFKHSLGLLCTEDNWTNDTLLDNEDSILAFTKHDLYPIKVFQNEFFFIYLEGRIYGKEDSLVQHELLNLAQGLVDDSDASQKDFLDWLLNADGEFIVFIQHKQSSRIFIFNDAFSHLPAFFNISKQKFILSRSLKLVAELAGNDNSDKFDQMSMAMYLIFSYYPFNLTPVKDVFRLEPASLITIYPKQKTIDKKIVHTFNFDVKEYNKKSLKHNAQKLALLLSKAVNDRVDPQFQTVLSLSGGMDSRAVLAALLKEELPFKTITWIDEKKVVKRDVEVAKKLAEMFDLDWLLGKLEQGRGKWALELLRFKDGMVPLWKTNIINFYNAQKQKYNSNIRFLSGNVGWSLRYTLQAKGKVKTPKELANFLVARYNAMPLTDIMELMSVSEDEIINEITNHLSKYPETDISRKHTHFLIYERGINFLVQGGDRLRSLFWHTFPDLSIHFFKYALNCPDKQKKNYKLYAQVLKNTYPQSIDIGRVAESKIIPIKDTPQERLKDLFVRICELLNTVRFVIKKLLRCFNLYPKQTKMYQYPPKLMDCLHKQVNNCSAVKKAICSDKLNKIINEANVYVPRVMASLFTLVSTIEWLSDNKSSIEDFMEENIEPFI